MSKHDCEKCRGAGYWFGHVLDGMAVRNECSCEYGKEFAAKRRTKWCDVCGIRSEEDCKLVPILVRNIEVWPVALDEKDYNDADKYICLNCVSAIHNIHCDILTARQRENRESARKMFLKFRISCSHKALDSQERYRCKHPMMKGATNDYCTMDGCPIQSGLADE